MDCDQEEVKMMAKKDYSKDPWLEPDGTESQTRMAQQIFECSKYTANAFPLLNLTPEEKAGAKSWVFREVLQNPNQTLLGQVVACLIEGAPLHSVGFYHAFVSQQRRDREQNQAAITEQVLWSKFVKEGGFTVGDYRVQFLNEKDVTVKPVEGHQVSVTWKGETRTFPSPLDFAGLVRKVRVEVENAPFKHREFTVNLELEVTVHVPLKTRGIKCDDGSTEEGLRFGDVGGRDRTFNLQLLCIETR